MAHSDGAFRGSRAGEMLAGLGAGHFWLLIAVAGAAVLFRDGLLELVEAWQTPEYTHGPVIPLLSAYLLLHQLKAWPPRPGRIPNRWPGVAVVALSILIALLGRATDMGDISAYGLIVWVFGMLLVSFGWERGRHLWPAPLHLVFMLPIPGVLHYRVSTELQLFSSELGVWLIQAAGVPVLLDGNIIDLGEFKLAVAEACSGLRYLFPIMSFSYVFATLYRGPVWQKAVLLLSAAPITILMNTVRIAMIGVIVDAYGISHAEGLSHFLEGWVIFLACVVMLFLLAWGMLRLQRSEMSLGEAMDLDLTGLGPQLARLRHVQGSGAMVAAAVGLAATATAWAWLPDPGSRVPPREPLGLFPAQLGEWRGGVPRTLDPTIAQTLAASDYYLNGFASEAHDAPVEFFTAWYADQTTGGIHSPEVCIPVGGWEIAEIERVDVAEVVGSAEPFMVNRAIIQKDLSRQLVYFWFDQAGDRTASDFTAKLNVVWNVITDGRSDGALLRLVTPMGPEETRASAEARLQDLLRELTPVLPRFVPGA